MNVKTEINRNSQENISTCKITEYVETEFAKLSEYERNDIKKIVNQTFKENLLISECFFELNERLDYILGMDTMKFVKKIINYYKQDTNNTRKDSKPVKKANEEIENLDTKNVVESKNIVEEKNVVESKNIVEAENSKKIETETTDKIFSNGKEVIFNEIPESIDEDKLRIFCEGLGEIEYIKKLNNIKYLIKFKEESSAFAAVDYRGPIYGVFLKKYFNNFSKSVEIKKRKENNNLNGPVINTEFLEKLLSLLRRQDAIVDQLYIKGEDELANELNEIKNEIKNLILKTKRN